MEGNVIVNNFTIAIKFSCPPEREHDGVPGLS